MTVTGTRVLRRAPGSTWHRTPKASSLGPCHPKRDPQITLCKAIVLPGRKSDFRAGFGPDCYRESTEIGPPAGRRPAGGQISVFSRLQSSQNPARKVDFQPRSTIAQHGVHSRSRYEHRGRDGAVRRSRLWGQRAKIGQQSRRDVQIPIAKR